MRALVQRVSEASVTVDGTVVGEIGPGLVVLICAMQGDAEAQAVWLSGQVAQISQFQLFLLA